MDSFWRGVCVGFGGGFARPEGLLGVDVLVKRAEGDRGDGAVFAVDVEGVALRVAGRGPFAGFGVAVGHRHFGGLMGVDFELIWRVLFFWC